MPVNVWADDALPNDIDVVPTKNELFTKELFGIDINPAPLPLNNDDDTVPLADTLPLILILLEVTLVFKALMLSKEPDVVISPLALTKNTFVIPLPSNWN